MGINKQDIINLVLNALTSEHSRRAYERALVDFLDWRARQGRPRLCKALVQSYKVELQDAGLAPSTVNLRLAAIRKLAVEAGDNGLLDPVLAQGIERVKGIKSAGVRSGNWLTREQAQRLLDSPDTATLKGLRDRAILAVLLGCGLRRSECAALTFAHVQQREGRWAICDMVGKGNRTRTVPMPSWAKSALDEWATAAALEDGRIFRSVRKGGHLAGDSVSPQGIADTVHLYAGKCGLDGLAAHDLRRTYAQLCYEQGISLLQVSEAMGHESREGTILYLSIDRGGPWAGLQI